jgi:ABC-type transporter Mla subunit MlaD
MPSLSERHRNNVRAGIFVTLSLLLALFVMIQISGVVKRLMQATTPYRVSFTVKSGIGNLKAGSEVRIGGVPMGRVKSVDPILLPDAPFEKIEVSFRVNSDVVMYSNAVILIGSPLLGSDSWLDIPNVGNDGIDPLTKAKTTKVPPDGLIEGSAGAGMLTTLLGADNKERADEIIENVRLVSVDARDFSKVLPQIRNDYDQKITPILDDVKTFADRFPGWGDQVDKVMQWAVDAGPRIDAAIAKGDDLLGQARDMVAENRPNIKDITDNVKTTSERLNNETIEKVHKLLDSGQQGVDQAVALIESLRVDYNAWATDVGESLANANLASQQLKLAMIEVRRSPWKVLYRPSDDELQHELLYDATRSFAIAAADLKASSESVRRIVDQQPALLQDPQNKEAFQRLTTNLLESLKTYEKAQQDLLDVLVSKK